MENYATTTTTSETLTLGQVKDMIVANQSQLKKDIRALNHKYGKQLTKEDCEDIFCNATYKALLHADTYDPSRTKMRTWMNRIARNEMIDVLKQKSFSNRYGVRYEDETGDDGVYDDILRQMHYRHDITDGTFSPILNNENSRLTKLRLDCLVKVIENLSSRDQSVIKMLFEGYSGREMAQELGISECAQRKLVSDMRGRLAKGLSKLHYADIDERTNQYQNEVICMDEELDHNSMFRFIYASLLSESI